MAKTVDRFELTVPDRRVQDGLVEVLAASKKATLADAQGCPFNNCSSFGPMPTTIMWLT